MHKSDKEIVAKLKRLVNNKSCNDTLFHTKSKVHGIWLSEILEGRF